MPIFLVMLGGALGSGLRYLAGVAGQRLLGTGFPAGTLFVNVSGGLLMGLLAALLARAAGGIAAAEPMRLLLGVGVLGGYTTFSSFTLETVTMIERGQPALALFYVLASALGAILALMLGLALGRSLAA
ncbi:CrcB family protein [Sphingomonas morindae]|uniref:Fluoride-specific ion channel FluC n=1 Tax=Sphingomonas morindae TaxID=1541170 RepID=A0ABY4X685_9SPHN|nr:CrcB family protein [Sphingomonas morindae]USI72391.1 CrcB family protein [Sphingomonas morindae]